MASCKLHSAPQIKAVCDFVSPLSTASAMRWPSSVELKTLPPWPAGLPVIKLAGNVDLVYDLFPTRLHIPVPLVGDMVVPAESAGADSADTDTCSSALSPLGAATSGVLNVVDWYLSPCFHLNLTSDAKLTDRMIAAVRAVVKSQSGTLHHSAPTPGPTTPTTSKAASPQSVKVYAITQPDIDTLCKARGFAGVKLTGDNAYAWLCIDALGNAQGSNCQDLWMK
jgi:hypothetical protein